MKIPKHAIAALSIGTILAVGASGGELLKEHRKEAVPRQRGEAVSRRLEMLILRCRLKLAEREKTVPAAAARLEKAELSHHWFARRLRDRQDPESRRILERYRLGSAALLVNAYREIAERAGKAGLRGTEEELRRRREEYLRALRGATWIRSAPEGRLWLAEQFLNQGKSAEALKDYRVLLATFDPDGDGVGRPDRRLPDFRKLRAAVRRTRGLGLAEFAEAREELDEIELCLRGHPAGKDGGPAAGAVVEPDYPRGIRLIDEFLKRRPGYDLDATGKAGTERNGLLAIRAEMDLRHKLFSARCGAVSAGVRLARTEREKGRKAAAAGLLAEALRRANVALRYRRNDTDLLLCRAECLLGTGEAGGARRAYRRLRFGSREGSEVWWAATRGLFAALEAEGDLKGARIVLVMAIRGYPREIAGKWPAARGHAARLAPKTKNPRPCSPGI